MNKKLSKLSKLSFKKHAIYSYTSSSGRSSSMTRLSMMKFWRSIVFLPM